MRKRTKRGGSSAQHHRGDGPASSLGPVSMGKEQRAVCSGGLVVAVEAAVWLKLGLSPSRVRAVVDELLHHKCVCLGMAETKRERYWCRHPVLDWPLKVGKNDSEQWGGAIDGLNTTDSTLPRTTATAMWYAIVSAFTTAHLTWWRCGGGGGGGGQRQTCSAQHGTTTGIAPAHCALCAPMQYISCGPAHRPKSQPDMAASMMGLVI